MKQKKYYLYILVLISIIQAFFLIYQAFIFKDLINNAIAKTSITKDIILCVSVVAIGITLKLISSFIKNKYSLYLEVLFKGQLFESLVNKKYYDISNIHSAELSNIYLTDIRNITQYYSSYIPQLFGAIARIIFAFVGLLILGNYIVLLLAVIGGILFLISRLYGKKVKKLNKEALASDDRLNLYMQESVENIRFLKVMSSTDDFMEDLNTELKDNYKYKNRRNRFQIFASCVFASLMAILYTAAMIYCAYLISKGKIEYGTLTAIVALVSYFEAPMAQISSIISRIFAALASIDRIKNLDDKIKELPSLELNSFDKIEIKDLSFRYNDRYIFDHFDFEINKNDLIIIKGPSGIGKSTLLNILLGFYNYNGNITVYSENKEYVLNETTRSLFSYVPQENILFSGTILTNIRKFNKGKSLEEIINVLKLVNVYDELLNLDDGLNHRIHERGKGLSIGQIQRILIAIALLKDKPILIMDEFTSALDYENEAIVSNIISKLNKTVIMVSHRDVNITDAKILNLGDEDED